MYELLSAVEICLARWCVLELEIGIEELRYVVPSRYRRHRRIDPLALDGIIDNVTKQKLWGKWAGRETTFYRECAQLVASLSWNDVVTIGGPEIKILARLVREAYAKLMSKEIPERLKVGNLQVISMNQDSSPIATYSSLDPLELPNRLIQALGQFDGRPTKEALKAVADEEDLKLAPSMVRQLIDFELLVRS